MDSFYKNLIALLIRSFIPASPFYTNLLVESKGFTNLDVSNRIAPFYFFSSFFAVFFCKKILHSIGISMSSVFVAATFFINLIFLLNLKQQNLIGARLIYFSSGFITTFDMVLRFYISETNTHEKKADRRYSYLSSLRAISSSVSACIGQEIVNRTGSYEIPMIISIFSQFTGFIISLVSSLRSKEKDTFIEIETSKAMLSMDKVMLCAFLAGIVSNCFNIFIRFFAQGIFRDKDFTLTPVNSKNKVDRVQEEHTEPTEVSNEGPSIPLKTENSDINNENHSNSNLLLNKNEGFQTIINDAGSIQKHNSVGMDYKESSKATFQLNATSCKDEQDNQPPYIDSDQKMPATEPSKNHNSIDSINNTSHEQNNVKPSLSYLHLIKNWLLFMYQTGSYLICAVGKLLNLPVIFSAIMCTKAVVCLFPKYKKQGNANKKYLNGNLDGLTNMMCYLISYIIVSNAYVKHKECLYISFLALSSINLLAMALSKNKVALYIMYLLTGVFAKACNQITKYFLKKTQDDNNLIVACFIIETIVHVVVNQGCKLYCVNSLKKAIVYATIGLVVSILIVLIKSSS